MELSAVKFQPEMGVRQGFSCGLNYYLVDSPAPRNQAFRGHEKIPEPTDKASPDFRTAGIMYGLFNLLHYVESVEYMETLNQTADQEDQTPETQDQKAKAEFSRMEEERTYKWIAGSALLAGFGLHPFSPLNDW